MRVNSFLPTLALFLNAAFSGAIHAENPLATVGVAESPPAIDGKLDDKCWKDCIEISNFIKYRGRGEMAKEDTKVYLTYDLENLYIAFKCRESHLNPLLNQRQLFKREATKDKKDTIDVFRDDCVEIFINDRKQASDNYRHICINSLGTIYDSLGPMAPKEWDSGAAAKGLVGNDEWTLEAAIPLKSLSKDKITPGKTVWSANFCRNSKPAKETSSWCNATAAKGFHAPEIFGEIHFVEKVPEIKNVIFSKFKAGNNFLYAYIKNSFDKTADYSLGLECVWDSSERMNFTERALLKAKEGKRFKLKYAVNSSNMCLRWKFDKPQDPTVTVLKSGALCLKPETDYVFKADLKTDYSLASGKPYNFFLLRSKSGYDGIPGATAPLKTNGWIQIKTDFRTPRNKEYLELWLVKWAKRNLKGELYVDNIELTEKSSGKNLLVNGDFQNGPTGWPICRAFDKGYGNAAEKMEYQYYLRSNEKILYRSPVYKRELFIENPVVSSQFVNFGDSGAYRVEDLFLSAGAPERLNLVLRSDKAKSVNKIFCEIKMPFCCRLRFPQSASTGIEPVKVEEDVKIEDGEKTRSYVMEFDNSAVSFSDSPSWQYVAVPLIFESIGWSSSKRSGIILYKAWINRKSKENKFHKLKLGLLPPLSGRRPEKLPLIIWAYPSKADLCMLSRDIQDAFIMKMANAGYNLAALNGRMLKKYEKHGINGFALLPTVTIASSFPEVKGFLKEHPECTAKFPDGKAANAIDPAYLLQKDCLFHKTMKDVFSRYAKVFSYSLNWDYEFGFMPGAQRRAQIGFSEKNLELFRKYANIPQSQKLDAGIIYSKYAEKWLDFRCGQNAKIAGIYRKLIKQINEKCMFSFYSGYPPNSAEHYGVEWKSMSKNVDLPMCGYCGNNRLMLKTIKQKYFNAGLLIMSYADQMPMENTLMNLLSDAGSYLSYIHFVVDGRFFYASSQAAAVAADFEDFFLGLKDNRHDELASGMDGKPTKDVKVIAKGKKRIALLFNYSSKEKKIRFRNKSLPENFAGIDCDEKKVLSDPRTVESSLAPWKTKAIYFCPVKELEAGFEKPPVPASRLQADGPILRWSDKDPFKKKYEIKCGAKADLSNAKTVADISECYFQLPEEMGKCDKIFWKVRSCALTEKKQSPWSAISEQSLASIRESFVFHKAPANNPFLKLGRWERISWGGGGPINILEKDYEIKKEGLYSLKCQNFFGNSYSYWTNYRYPGGSTKLPRVSKGEKYLLSGWIKTNGTSIKSYLSVILRGEDGKTVKFIDSQPVEGGSDWKKIELRFDIPSEEIKTFSVCFKANGKGAAWCSGIKLEKVSP